MSAKTKAAASVDDSPRKAQTVLVLGATGATGKHVVNQLLDRGHKVHAIVRSAERMRDLITSNNHGNASVIEGSVMDISNDDFENHVKTADAVVSCLGHNMSFKGMFGHPRYLCTDVTRKVTDAIEKTSTNSKKKFILMNSEGVPNPAGTDDIRPRSERAILAVLRTLIFPVKDNEAAAKLLHSIGKKSSIEWTAVRPVDLIDGDTTDYTLLDKPEGSLFGGSVATRSNVAKFMVDLILDDSKWQKNKFKMPVVRDTSKPK